MFSTLIDFFKPPQFDSFELTQKAKFLHVTLLTTTIVCIFLGIQNMAGETYLDVVLFILSGISFLFIPINKKGYDTLIVIFISSLILVVITFSLIDGVGLKDAGLIAYPLLIIFTSFLLSKKASFATTLLSIGAVLLVHYLDIKGYLDPPEFSNEDQLKAIIALLIATGFFLWAVMDNWDRVTQNLKRSYDSTLSGWGKALEYRDKETQGHSQRVTEMTIELAKRMGVTNRELEHIHRGALLHDIGKMAVPDAILLKNGRLTDYEWQIMKMHPTHAKELLESIPFLVPALDIPYCHHERWDGTGYPRGLKGEQIPLAARIFSVVDNWDALRSKRPYREAWPKEKVLDYIREKKGIFFDPRVVDMFFELIEKRY